MDKVRIIEGSLRCFTFGLLSLFPLLGLAASFVSIAEYAFVKHVIHGQWNPAHRYLRGGLVLGILGLLINGLPILFLGSFILMKLVNGFPFPFSLFP